MRPFLLAALLAIIPRAALAQGEEDSTSERLVAEQVRTTGVDYSRTLAAARDGDRAELGRLFRVSLAVDKAGAAWHGGQLWDLLQRWGDSAYAAVLGPEPPDVRGRVLCLVRMEACDPRNPRWYPRTFALDPRPEPCECDS